VVPEMGGARRTWAVGPGLKEKNLQLPEGRTMGAGEPGNKNIKGDSGESEESRTPLYDGATEVCQAGEHVFARANVGKGNPLKAAKLGRRTRKSARDSVSDREGGVTNAAGK